MVTAGIRSCVQIIANIILHDLLKAELLKEDIKAKDAAKCKFMFCIRILLHIYFQLFSEYLIFDIPWVFNFMLTQCTPLTAILSSYNLNSVQNSDCRTALAFIILEVKLKGHCFTLLFSTFNASCAKYIHHEE